jgi:GntR family transcriptional regulator of arabinose operon
MTRLTEAISRRIYEDITAGAYAPGSRIPSERELEQIYQVSRVTVNRALTRLHARGVVERRRGSGTYVTQTIAEKPPVESSSLLVKYIALGAKVRGDIYVSSGHEGMCNELNKHGKDVVTRFYYSEAEYLAELRGLSGSDLAGAIVWYCPSREGDRLLEDLTRQQIRLVLMDNHSETLACDYVGTDNAQGSRLMVRHLAAMGHRHIAYVTQNVAGLQSLESRQVGFVQELLGSGLPLTQESLWSFDINDPQGLENVVDALLASSTRPTAIYAANDYHAFEIYHLLVKRGIRVPQDVSLAGFDNIDRSKHFEVPLTTIAQDFWEIGRTAAAILQQPVTQASPGLFYQISIKPSLIVRDSVAHAPR